MVDKRTLQTREKLLRAASQVTLQSGVHQLTLEAVAAAAGSSKGGLLYHFPSKEALIVGMIEYYLAHFEQRLAQKLTTPSTPQTWLRAYVEASFESDSFEDQMSASLIAAVALNPELLHPLRQRYAEWQQQILASTPHPMTALIVRLVIDGVWISNLLQLAPPSPDQHTQLRDYLLDLIGE